MTDTDAIVDAELTQLGWQWGNAHVVVGLATPQGPLLVRVPFASVWQAFRQWLPGAGVGCPHTVGGLWGSIKKAARSIKRKAKKAYKSVVPKRIQRAANQVLQRARKALAAAKTAFQSDAAMYAMMGLAVVPGMAPASAGLLAARAALKKVDAARKVANAVLAGAGLTSRMKRTLSEGVRVKEQTQAAVQAAREGRAHAQSFVQGLASLGL